MNCTQHTGKEAVRFCHHCKKFLCHGCMASGYCRHCDQLLNKHTAWTLAVSLAPFAVSAALGVGYLLYGFLSEASQAKYVWPYYLLLISAIIIPITPLLHRISRVLLGSLILFTGDLIRLVNYIDAITE